MSELRIPDAIDTSKLDAMQMVAKMKESADKLGIGFVGGFVAADGQKFVMTNLEQDDYDRMLPDNLK